jgi:hypothetical protein
VWPAISVPAYEGWYAEQQKRVLNTPLAGKVDFGGEVEKEQKIALLDGVDVLCVPTSYPETKASSCSNPSPAARRWCSRPTARSPS